MSAAADRRGPPDRGGGGHRAGGSPARRAAAGLIFVAGLAVWAVTAAEVGGPGFALTTPHGLWTTLLYWTLLIGLALAASAPMRQAVVAETLPAALAPR